MCHGIECARPEPREEWLGIKAAAQQFGVSISELEQYTREGVLISLKTLDGPCYTLSDYRWVATLGRLLREAHLSFEEIRQLLAKCACWEVRHCDFHSKQNCPLINDGTKPCWINRSMCSVLSSYPCYSCIVYRAAPDAEGFRAALGGSAPAQLLGFTTPVSKP